MALTALHGSSLESTLFRRQFAVDAISADPGLALALARAQGIGLLQISAANIGTVDASDHAAPVQDSIRNQAANGYRIEVPARRLTHNAWTGSVWVATDPASGAAGYFISGGLAGGATATAPQKWTLDCLAAALGTQDADDPNRDPTAGHKILKVGGAQRVPVGKELPKPLSVTVWDNAGKPVEGAPVTFTVTQGGGNLNGATTAVRKTNKLGMASVYLTLSERTDSNALSELIKPTDQFGTQVGWNVVDATTPRAWDCCSSKRHSRRSACPARGHAAHRDTASGRALGVCAAERFLTTFRHFRGCFTPSPCLDR